MSLWKRIDTTHNITHITENDVCAYAREYNSRQGYGAGETNQLIFNFKKPPTAQGQPQWHYRTMGVQQFANEVAQLFQQGDAFALTAIPSSTRPDDPNYTNRFEDAFAHLLQIRPNLVIEWPIGIAQTIPAAHAGGTRNPATIRANYVWQGFRHGTPRALYLCDDVVTSGAHFRAASDFLRDNGFTGIIIGLFWARAI